MSLFMNKTIRFVEPSYAVRVHSKMRAARVVHYTKQIKLHWAPSSVECVNEINNKGYMMH